jgi:hypothetical protein
VEPSFEDALRVGEVADPAGIRTHMDARARVCAHGPRPIHAQDAQAHAEAEPLELTAREATQCVPERIIGRDHDDALAAGEATTLEAGAPQVACRHAAVPILIGQEVEPGAGGSARLVKPGAPRAE